MSQTECSLCSFLFINVSDTDVSPAVAVYVAFPYRVVEQNEGISSDCNRLRPWKDTHFIHGLLKSCRIPNIPRGCADRVCIPECNCPNSTWFDNDPNVWYCVQQGYCKDGMCS